MTARPNVRWQVSRGLKSLGQGLEFFGTNGARRQPAPRGPPPAPGPYQGPVRKWSPARVVQTEPKANPTDQEGELRTLLDSASGTKRIGTRDPSLARPKTRDRMVEAVGGSGTQPVPHASGVGLGHISRPITVGPPRFNWKHPPARPHKQSRLHAQSGQLHSAPHAPPDLGATENASPEADVSPPQPKSWERSRP